MHCLRKAFQILKEITASAVESPRSMLDAIKLLPSFAKGLKFASATHFPSPPEQPAGIQPESNPLLEYFNSHTEGPGLWKWLHYFDIYHRHFQKFVGREVHILEVGIYSGGSLAMWREYFGKNCKIYGVDIEPACMTYKSDGIEVFIGDQSDRGFWGRFREQVPKVDILIDDGGHDPEQQRITLEEMLPHLQPGGVYLCEDIGSRANRFGGYVSGLMSQMNFQRKTIEIFDAPMIPSGFQASVGCVTQYPFVTVIEKHAKHPGLFVSKKHGTEWQPY
jgi:SAM-dependent methyltransferase